ncbi:MAG: hypothetical protein IPH37_16820 [Burkholderiales bacterium]|nr:hypothetical protein [Burkholderiales bacterium]
MDTIQRLKALGALPIVLQLGLVHQTPLFDDGCHLAGQLAFDTSPLAMNQASNPWYSTWMCERRMVVMPHANPDDSKNGE